MNVLFLTQVLPYPLDAGPKVRAYYTLRHLANKHEITLLSFVRPDDPPSALEHLKMFCQRIVTMPIQRARWRDALFLLVSLVSGRPFLIQRDVSLRMAWQIILLCLRQSFDVVHADQLWMAKYALLARTVSKLKKYSPALLLDQHNAVFQVPRRLAENARNYFLRALYRLECQKMILYEKRICLAFDKVVWVTSEDYRSLEVFCGMALPPTHCKVIPICIETSQNSYSTVSPRLPQVLFVGGMHWPPNNEGVTWFYQYCWARIREAVPEARLVVIGKSPPKTLPHWDGVYAPGFIEDLQPYWEESSVFIVPLLSAGGMRVKILDAWLNGLPVVSSTIGAEGLNYRDGEHLLIADKAEDFAKAVIRVLCDPALATHLAHRARAWVTQHYDWRKVYTAWDEVYATV